MYVLINAVLRFTISSVIGPFCRQIGCVLVLVVLGCSLVAAAPLSKQEPATPSDHLHRVWQDNHYNVWFYAADGHQVVPKLSEEWLAVRFSAEFATNSDMPAAIRQFNQRYDEALADVVYSPAHSDLALYRFKPTHRSGALSTILAGDDPTIRYVLPALIVDDETRILGERISVRWKSQLRNERRKQLLRSIGAIDYDIDLSAHDEEIVIDPSRMAVWQAANRLAEDVQVVSATPELLDVSPPVTIQFQVDSRGTVAGAAMPFSLDIHFSDTVQIEPGTIANLNLKPQEIYRNLFAIDYETSLSSVDVRHGPIQLRGTLYLYANGEFELPTIPIFYRVEGRDPNKIHRVDTAPVRVRLAALVPEADGDYRLQVPTSQADVRVGPTLQPAPLSHADLWRALIALVLLIAGSVYALSRRARSYQQPTQIVESTTTQLLQHSLASVTRSQHFQSLANLGLTLRAYLLDWCQAGDLSQGGGVEQFSRQLHPYVPQPWQQQIQQTLHLVDDTLAREGSDADVAAVVEQVEKLVVELESQRQGPRGDGSVPNLR